MRKGSVDDVPALFEACPHLSPLQVQKVLSMYTPGAGEERVPAAVLRAVVAHGATAMADAAALTLEVGRLRAVTLPYVPAATDFAGVAAWPANLAPTLARRVAAAGSLA